MYCDVDNRKNLKNKNHIKRSELFEQQSSCYNEVLKSWPIINRCIKITHTLESSHQWRRCVRWPHRDAQFESITGNNKHTHDKLFKHVKPTVTERIRQINTDWSSAEWLTRLTKNMRIYKKKISDIGTI